MKPIAKGYVLAVMPGSTTFWARIYACRNGQLYCGTQMLDVRIEKALLASNELKYLQNGAYLNLSKSGTWRFVKDKWKKRDLNAAQASAAKTLAKLQERFGF
jgi:hypothetical protein